MDLLSLSLSSSSVVTAPHTVCPLSRRRLCRSTPPRPSPLSTHLASKPPPMLSLSPSPKTHFSSLRTHSYKAFVPELSGPQTHESAMRGAESDVMGLLLEERIVFLGSTIDDFVADAIIGQLLLLDAEDPTKDIRIFINSTGGSLSATMAIYDVLQLVRADVSTIALGMSAATASIVLGGGTRGKRLAMPNSRIMIRQPLGGIRGQVEQVEVQAQEIMKSKETVIQIISGFTGRSTEEVEKDVDRDNYMSAIEAVEYGIIDGIIDRDSIIPLAPLPEMAKPVHNFAEISKDVMKYLVPDIPDDEIY